LAPGNEPPAIALPTYPFVGIPTFLRSEYCRELDQLDADIAVLGFPSDEGSPYMPGARFGPRAMREHSLRFRRTGFYDSRQKRMIMEEELTAGRLVDVGDVDVLPTNAELTFARATDVVRTLLDRGALPVVMGGDHAVSFPVVRAFTDPVHVFHFDAHIDYAPFIHGYEYTNAHAFRQIHHMSHVQSLTQVGIRGLRNPHAWVQDSLQDGNRIVTMEEFRDLSMTDLVGALPQGSKVYVSIDIDVLDMSLVPGCVSAEPDGMAYADLRDVLMELADHVEIVGMDLVEVNPQLDVATGVTSYLATNVILELLGRICEQAAWKERTAERAAARQQLTTG
jgi:agmatinase